MLLVRAERGQMLKLRVSGERMHRNAMLVSDARVVDLCKSANAHALSTRMTK